MKTFEYHTVSANPAPCDWMEEFGIEGWELVAIVYRENSGGVFYFKREINNPTPETNNPPLSKEKLVAILQQEARECLESSKNNPDYGTAFHTCNIVLQSLINRLHNAPGEPGQPKT